MSELHLDLLPGSVFHPGETLAGVASWELEQDVESLEVRLIWFTRGKGTQDVQMISYRSFPSPGRAGEAEFSFDLPNGPYSFSGKLISLIWALELVTPKGKQSSRVEFVLTPFEKEIELGSAEGANA